MILHEILTTKGYKSRMIQLIRQVGSSYDTHVVTEVYSKNLKKFILLDPTFNLMFKLNGKYINANEVRESYLYKKNILDIIEIKGKNIQKYNEYSLEYMSLYNNVFIVKVNRLEGIQRLLSKLPIIHNSLGGKYFVSSYESVKGVSILYRLFYFYIPFFLLLNIVFIIFDKAIKRYG